jgi:hypothetical protein
VDRHFYELCALAELRDRLRAGDIWVTGGSFPGLPIGMCARSAMCRPLPA